jgi:hypothetical protein
MQQNRNGLLLKQRLRGERNPEQAVAVGQCLQSRLAVVFLQCLYLDRNFLVLVIGNEINAVQ